MQLLNCQRNEKAGNNVIETFNLHISGGAISRYKAPSLTQGKFGIFQIFGSGPGPDNKISNHSANTKPNTKDANMSERRLTSASNKIVKSAFSRASTNVITEAKNYIDHQETSYDLRQRNQHNSSNLHSPPIVTKCSLIKERPENKQKIKKLKRSSSLNFGNRKKLLSKQSRNFSNENASSLKIPRVFLSEPQSQNLVELGNAVPGAPPATPTPYQLSKVEYIPPLTDIRSKRDLTGKLKEVQDKIQLKFKKRQSELEKIQKHEELEKTKDLKRQQRNVIYSLNAIMTDIEYTKYNRFMNENGLQA